MVGPGDEDPEKAITRPKRSGEGPDPTAPARTRAPAEAEGQDAARTKPGEQSQELTRAELRVLRLVAIGLTNQEVADQLGLSVYTVQTHLRSVYAKLKVRTRGAAIRRAFDNKIV